MAARRERRQEPAGGEGAPGWMVTYGDMMGLLLTFFILLVAYSSMDTQKFTEALLSVQGALGVLSGEGATVPVSDVSTARRAQAATVERLARQLRQHLQVMGKASDIKLELDQQGGLRINVPSQILFDSARADLKPEAFEILSSVAELLAGVPDAAVEIAGHTDDRPLKNTAQYRDNYELGFARAMGVARFLNEQGAIPLTRFEILALGPNRPVATNDTEEGRQANRRVEIYVRGPLSDREKETMRARIGALAGQTAGTASSGAGDSIGE